MTSGSDLYPQPGSPPYGAAGAVVPPPSASATARQPRTEASRPAGLQGRVISYGEFISAVQEVGALETAAEAERAATATLSELAGCLSWPVGQNLAACLPRPLRQLLSRRSFDSSMSRFSPRAFARSVAEQERVELKRAARDTRAVLLALDQALPKFLADQLHKDLASLWGPLTAHQERTD
jgi:uncharacterized protein (DUF2267 family)